jgi:hypothetical protein
VRSLRLVGSLRYIPLGTQILKSLYKRRISPTRKTLYFLRFLPSPTCRFPYLASISPPLCLPFPFPRFKFRRSSQAIPLYGLGFIFPRQGFLCFMLRFNISIVGFPFSRKASFTLYLNALFYFPEIPNRGDLTSKSSQESVNTDFLHGYALFLQSSAILLKGFKDLKTVVGDLKAGNFPGLSRILYLAYCWKVRLHSRQCGPPQRSPHRAKPKSQT